MKKIFLAVPVRRYLEPEMIESVTRFVYRENSTYTVGSALYLRGSPNIYMQHYNLAQEFLKTDCDYYLYFDTDQQIVGPETAIELMVQANKDIICPLIVRRYFPHMPTVLTFERRQRNIQQDTRPLFEDFREQKEPFEVYFCSGGLVLIRREVITSVQKPFYPVIDPMTEQLLSVDYSLYYKAKKKGFRCWADPRIDVAHIGHYPFMMTDYYAMLDAGLTSDEKNGIVTYSMKGEC